MDRQFNLDSNDYNEFKAFLKASCGIDLGNNKEYLVATRVRRIIAENGISSIGQLTDMVKSRGNEVLKQQVVDAMTTNETYWFRDGYPFEYLLSTLLPTLIQSKKDKPIRIWSAACSAGQEPYSISMIVDEYIRRHRPRHDVVVDIVATDLSVDVMNKAKSGRYDRLSVARGLSQERMAQYFTTTEHDFWTVNADIRQRVQFRALNLQDSFALMGKYDLIYCRNVLIYFSAELKLSILQKLSQCLNPSGTLFLGASESINGAEALFNMVNCRPGIAYLKR